MISGDITVDGNQIRGASGGDFAGEPYYRLDGPGVTVAGATNGGRSRIIYNGGMFTVDSGLENYPVTFVSWYGAKAFAEYYCWRLPTEDEWESVANYNDDRTYATGSSLYDNERFFANYKANGYDANTPNNLPYHPYVEYGTTPVCFFGLFGYGLADMAGNVWDWTSTTDGSDRISRGGCWITNDSGCAVSTRGRSLPGSGSSSKGFRVSR